MSALIYTFPSGKLIEGEFIVVENVVENQDEELEMISRALDRLMRDFYKERAES